MSLFSPHTSHMTYRAGREAGMICPSVVWGGVPRRKMGGGQSGGVSSAERRSAFRRVHEGPVRLQLPRRRRRHRDSRSVLHRRNKGMQVVAFTNTCLQNCVVGVIHPLVKWQRCKSEEFPLEWWDFLLAPFVRLRNRYRRPGLERTRARHHGNDDSDAGHGP